MTLNRWFVVLASTAVLTGCENAVAPPEPNQLTATWAGKAWIGNAVAGIVQGGSAGDTLYVWAAGPIDNRILCLCPTVNRPSENEITVKVVFTGPGTYALGPGAAKFEQVVGGDVVSATYRTNAEATGTLVVSAYEGIGYKIEGSLSFDAVSNDQYKGFGPRASLEGGRFRATVQEVPKFQR